MHHPTQPPTTSHPPPPQSSSPLDILCKVAAAESPTPSAQHQSQTSLPPLLPSLPPADRPPSFAPLPPAEPVIHHHVHHHHHHHLHPAAQSPPRPVLRLSTSAPTYPSTLANATTLPLPTHPFPRSTPNLHQRHQPAIPQPQQQQQQQPTQQPALQRNASAPVLGGNSTTSAHHAWHHHHHHQPPQPPQFHTNHHLLLPDPNPLRQQSPTTTNPVRMSSITTVTTATNSSSSSSSPAVPVPPRLPSRFTPLPALHIPPLPRSAPPAYALSPPCASSPPLRAAGTMKTVARKSTGRRDSYTRFTAEEEAMLLEGVSLFGVGNWKKILNSYQFHWKRTAVDLKDKYRNITRAKMRRMNASSQSDLSSVASSDGDTALSPPNVAAPQLMQCSPLQGPAITAASFSPLSTPSGSVDGRPIDQKMTSLSSVLSNGVAEKKGHRLP